MRRPRLSADEAEAIALAAFVFLAEEPGRIGLFLRLSGMEPAELRAAAATRAFQTAVLAHLRGDESLALVFASGQGLAPERLAEAEALLGRAE